MIPFVLVKSIDLDSVVVPGVGSRRGWRMTTEGYRVSLGALTKCSVIIYIMEAQLCKCTKTTEL